MFISVLVFNANKPILWSLQTSSLNLRNTASISRTYVQENCNVNINVLSLINFVMNDYVGNFNLQRADA